MARFPGRKSMHVRSLERTEKIYKGRDPPGSEKQSRAATHVPKDRAEKSFKIATVVLLRSKNGRAEGDRTP